MRKIICLLTCCLFSLNADVDVEALKQNVHVVLPTLEGWCSKSKANNFIDLVLDVKPDTCVEIGVFGGSSIYPVASALKALGKGVVIGIDPWDKIECIKYFDPIEDAEHLKWWGQLNITYIYHSYMNMIKKNKLEDFVKTIRATSEEAASLVGAIDILYIDGNHSDEVSLRDVQLYLPNVKTGGYIWLNDTLGKERQDAIELLAESCDVIKLIDNGNCILFKKR
jgi:cephalosporin hydroxylase